MPPGGQLAFISEGIRPFYNGKFVNKRNQSMQCYYWRPSGKTRALLMISHGFTEHSMVYDDLATAMAQRGFFVFSHDHIGHGRSDGTRAYMNDMHYLVEDSLQHMKIIQEEYPDLPLFLCGHSMGGAVSLLASLQQEVTLSGVVLIAPALAPNPETASPWKVAAVKVLNKYFPNFPIAYTDFNLSCQSPRSVNEMDRDPLRFHGYWKVRPVMCLLQTGKELIEKSSEINVPFLLLHGERDKVCNIAGSRKLFEGASSEDKTLKVYPTGYHSLLQEPDEISKAVFSQTVQWLDSRAPQLET